MFTTTKEKYLYSMVGVKNIKVNFPFSYTPYKGLDGLRNVLNTMEKQEYEDFEVHYKVFNNKWFDRLEFRDGILYVDRKMVKKSIDK